MNNNNNDFLYKDISTLKGVGTKLKKYLKKKESTKSGIYFLIFPMK